MYKLFAVFVCLVTWSMYSHGEDATRYVRDWMSIPLHATAMPDSQTVHSGLVSGNAVTLLESDDAHGYSRVRVADGTEGWIATRYLTTEPTARLQLEKANAELTQLHNLKTQLANLPADIRSATQQMTDLRSDNAHLQTELDAIKTAAPNVADTIAENENLKASNTAQQQQLAALTTELQLQRSGNEHAQFRDGALAVIGGVLVALFVRRAWPKKRSEWS